jgi:hypothetical protein
MLTVGSITYWNHTKDLDREQKLSIVSDESMIYSLHPSCSKTKQLETHPQPNIAMPFITRRLPIQALPSFYLSSSPHLSIF